MENNIRLQNFPLQDVTNRILGIAIEIHKLLGPGFLEIVYKDAFELEFLRKEILFEREKEYMIIFKEAILKHKYFADFVVFEKVILEIKAKETSQKKIMLKQLII